MVVEKVEGPRSRRECFASLYQLGVLSWCRTYATLKCYLGTQNNILLQLLIKKSFFLNLIHFVPGSTIGT